MQMRRQAKDVKLLLESLQLEYISYNNCKLFLLINRNNSNSSQLPKFRKKDHSFSYKMNKNHYLIFLGLCYCVYQAHYKQNYQVLH